MEPLLGGEWTGKYWDAAGQNAALTLTIAVTGQSFSGSCLVAPMDIEGSNGYSLPVTGSVSGDTISFTVTAGEPPQQLTFNGRLRDAGNFADQAIFGVSENTQSAVFSGGVWILWRPAQ